MNDTVKGVVKQRIAHHNELVKAVVERANWLTKKEKGAFWPNKTTASFDAKRGYMRGTTYTGPADVIGCYRGRHIELETKTGRATLKTSQRQHRDRIEAAGGIFRVIRKPEDVDAVLEEVK